MNCIRHCTRFFSIQKHFQSQPQDFSTRQDISRSESVRVVQLPHGYPVGAGRDSVAPGVTDALPVVFGLDGSVGRRLRDGRRDAEAVIIKLHLLLLEEDETDYQLLRSVPTLMNVVESENEYQFEGLINWKSK